MNTALLYASQIAAALAEAHAKGIVHRDLKPGNIMIAKSGIKVLDFGLARSGQDQTVTASRMVMGTPAYMAPEQREGKPADARADIYSFGCVLYEMFTGATVAPQRRRIPLAEAGKNRQPVSGRRPGAPVAICRRIAARTGGVTTTKTHRNACVAAAVGMLALFAAAYFYFQPAPSSPTRTRSSSPSSPTRRATRCSTTRCDRDSRCSSSSRRSSASSPTNASEERCR